MNRRFRFVRSLLILGSICIGGLFSVHASSSLADTNVHENVAVADSLPADFDFSKITSHIMGIFGNKKTTMRAPKLTSLPFDVRQDIEEKLSICEQFLSNINAIPYYRERCSRILSHADSLGDTVSYAKNLTSALQQFLLDLDSGAFIKFTAPGKPAGEEQIKVSPDMLMSLLQLHKANILNKTEDFFVGIRSDIDQLVEFLTAIQKKDIKFLNKLVIERLQPQFAPIKSAIKKTLSEKIAPLKASLARQPRISGVIEQETALIFYENELRTTLNTIEAFFGRYEHSTINLDWMLSLLTILFQFWDYFEDTTLADYFYKPYMENYAEATSGSIWGMLGTTFLVGIPIIAIQVLVKTTKKLLAEGDGKFSYMLMFRVIFAGAASLNNITSTGPQKSLVDHLYGKSPVYKREAIPSVGATAAGNNEVTYNVQTFINPLNTVQMCASALFQGVAMAVTQFPAHQHKLNLPIVALFGAKAFTIMLWQFIKGDITNLWPSDDSRVKKLIKAFLTSFVCKGIFDIVSENMLKAIPTPVHEWSKSLSFGLLDFNALKDLVWEIGEPTLLLGIFSPEQINSKLKNPLSNFLYNSVGNIDTSFVFSNGKHNEKNAAGKFVEVNNGTACPIDEYYTYAKDYGYHPYAYLVATKIFSYGVKQVCKTGGRFVAPLIWKGASVFFESVHRVYTTLYFGIPHLFDENFDKEVDQALAKLNNKPESEYVLSQALSGAVSDLNYSQTQPVVDANVTKKSERLPITQVIKEVCVDISASITFVVKSLMPFLLSSGASQGGAFEMLSTVFSLKGMYMNYLFSHGKISLLEKRCEIINPLILENSILSFLQGTSVIQSGLGERAGNLITAKEANIIKKQYQVLLKPCADIRTMKSAEQITEMYKDITLEKVTKAILEGLDPALRPAMELDKEKLQQLALDEMKAMAIEETNKRANDQLTVILLQAIKNAIPAWIGEKVAEYIVAPFVTKAVINLITYGKLNMKNFEALANTAQYV